MASVLGWDILHFSSLMSVGGSTAINLSDGRCFFISTLTKFSVDAIYMQYTKSQTPKEDSRKINLWNWGCLHTKCEDQLALLLSADKICIGMLQIRSILYPASSGNAGALIKHWLAACMEGWEPMQDCSWANYPVNKGAGHKPFIGVCPRRSWLTVSCPCGGICPARARLPRAGAARSTSKFWGRPSQYKDRTSWFLYSQPNSRQRRLIVGPTTADLGDRQFRSFDNISKGWENIMSGQRECG